MNSRRNFSFERILLLFVPYGLAMLVKSDPIFSYFIAWIGSFYIFALTLTGIIKPLPADRPVVEQVMRPIFIVQIIFAGYMCCTSIFYLLSTLGYDNFEKTSKFFLVDNDKLELIAQCQRYYCLGHAAFVSGILVVMRYPDKQKFKFDIENIAMILLISAVVSFPLSIIFLKVPGLSQFSNQFSSLSFIAGTLALAFAIPQKKPINTIASVALYLFNFYTALISGYKEPIILSVLVLGIFLYPNYKKLVLFCFLPALFFLFLVLPTYVNTFRKAAWSGELNADEASKAALDAAFKNDMETDDDDIDNTNWGFLVNRLSEIDMFTVYVQSTPDKISYYGLKLVGQSAMALVPRIFWPSKPNTEALIMERVYDAGVVNKNSMVSAKPPYIVDAYLSGGTLGIIIFLFIYGAVAQHISQKAELLFGGYLLGTALIFSGLFQVMWRGISFEFIANSVFWSYVSMYLIAWLLRQKNIIQPV